MITEKESNYSNIEQMSVAEIISHINNEDKSVALAIEKALPQIEKVIDVVIEKMMEISKNPLLLRIFNYGKHKGKKVEEVVSYDRSYLEWMLEQKLNNEYYDEDWIYTLKYHLKIQ